MKVLDRFISIEKYCAYSVDISEYRKTRLEKEITRVMQLIDKYKEEDSPRLVSIYEAELWGMEKCLTNFGWEVKVRESS